MRRETKIPGKTGASRVVVLVLGSGGGLRHLVQARLGEIKPSAPLASHSNLVWIKSKLGALAAPLHARSNFPLFRDGDIKCKSICFGVQPL